MYSTLDLASESERMDHEHSKTRDNPSGSTNVSVSVVVPPAMEFEMFDLRAVVSTEVPFTN